MLIELYPLWQSCSFMLALFKDCRKRALYSTLLYVYFTRLLFAWDSEYFTENRNPYHPYNVLILIALSLLYTRYRIAIEFTDCMRMVAFQLILYGRGCCDIVVIVVGAGAALPCFSTVLSFFFSYLIPNQIMNNKWILIHMGNE